MILHQVQGGLLALPVDAQLGPGAVVHKLSVLGQNGGEGIIQALQHRVAAGEGELTFRSYAALAFGYRGEGGELSVGNQIPELLVIHEGGISAVLQLDFPFFPGPVAAPETGIGQSWAYVHGIVPVFIGRFLEQLVVICPADRGAQRITVVQHHIVTAANLVKTSLKLTIGGNGVHILDAVAVVSLFIDYTFRKLHIAVAIEQLRGCSHIANQFCQIAAGTQHNTATDAADPDAGRIVILVGCLLPC